nr:uncharacterized protein LOC111518268 isoform X2 [Leptinotarsa decemlineata]
MSLQKEVRAFICGWNFVEGRYHLILETDPEKGKTEYAFDNPGFKDASYLSVTKTPENKSEASKSKWSKWSPLSALTTKSEKRKTLDDMALEENEAKVVALRGHDFTGLGFNICGNMKEGIYIKDVLHRGPAFESGKLSPGDRISSITINLEHMVYEDALTILSYASPYDVMIEARSGKSFHSNTPGQGGQPSHPVYRSSSCADLYHVEKAAKKRLFGEEYGGSLSSNYSSLQKSGSNMTTLERRDSKSPLTKQTHAKKPSKHLNPEQLKSNLEQRILTDHQHNLRVKDSTQEVQADTQKNEYNFSKFGIRVMPLELQQKSPKSMEQNENNINIEKHLEIMSIDEVDDLCKPAPPVKRREKKAMEAQETFERNSLNGSGIKRNQDGIPLELPPQMLNAANAALKNRKSQKEGDEGKPIRENEVGESREEEARAIRKKGKAPSPPDDLKLPTNFDEIHSIEDEEAPPILPDSQWEYIDVKRGSPQEDAKAYNSDSDLETDNQSSVNTIELNSTDITIHQTEEEERQNRKTVSTGDLSKIRTKKSVNGLERAQSLDISDPKHKGGRNSDEDDPILNREPRLSLILDGLNTFQRNRLKKSTEWGNLEDAIMKLDHEDHSLSNESSQMLDISSVSEETPEFDALVNKINEIKRESGNTNSPDRNVQETNVQKIVENLIWPSLGSQGSEEKVYVVRADKLNRQVQREGTAEESAVMDEIPVFENPSDELNFPKENVVPRKVNNRIFEPFENNTEFENVNTISVPEFKPSEDFSKSKTPALQKESQSKNSVKSSIVPNRISSRQRVPEDIPLLPPETQSEPNQVQNMTETGITNTSPSLRLEDDSLDIRGECQSTEVRTSSNIKSEEVLSKIPLLNSMVKNQKEAIQNTLVGNNNTDETKTAVTLNIQSSQPDLLDITQNFLYTEQLNCNQDDYTYSSKGTNIPDDIKVSRHSYGSLEREIVPKSDDAKSKDFLKHVCNVNVNSNGDTELHSLELSINDPSELYTTAMDSTALNSDMIKNATLKEVLTALKDDGDSVVADVSKDNEELTGGQFSSSTKIFPLDTPDNSVESSSFTYITEIQVTPNTSAETNISEIQIIPEAKSKRNLDTEFENYVKSFDSKLESFESNIQEFDKNLEEFINEEPTSIIVNEQVDENELHKIQEIAEQQLKKLPEMKFTTASYESSRIPEKRQSQIELLRSNFEKSPPKTGKPEVVVKSRIPISTSAKTPPTSPERRDSHNLEMENDRALLELMSSSVSSTPYTTSKYQTKPLSKNVTVTSIRSNSKIPSGLPTLGGSRASFTPRKIELGDSNVVQVASNGNLESTFKQWVFNPSNVTNVIVTNNKEK